MTPRSVTLVACAAAMAATGCSDPVWTRRDDDMMSETRRMAEKLQKDIYIPPDGSSGGGGRFFVKVTAIDAGAAAGKPLDFGRGARQSRLGWGLRAVSVPPAWVRALSAGLPEGAVVSRSLILSGSAPGLLRPPAEEGDDAEALTIVAERERGGTALTLRTAAPASAAAERDLRLIILPGGPVAIAPMKAKAALGGQAKGLMSVMTGRPARALVIEVWPLR